MSEILTLLILSTLAGASIPAGAGLAVSDLKWPGILSEPWRRFIVAFGGGALISAVALVLVPEGSESISSLIALTSFALGGVCFCLLDVYLGKLKSSFGQLVAMLTDFIPEAMVLGAAFATGQNTGLLISALIVLQNIPEGFNAFEELTENSTQPAIRLLMGFGLLTLAGPLSGLLGFYYLPDRPELLGMIMLFASGGIIYLVFEDVAPQAKLENHWSPALGAVFGFLLGLAGHLAVSS